MGSQPPQGGFPSATVPFRYCGGRENVSNRPYLLNGGPLRQAVPVLAVLVVLLCCCPGAVLLAVLCGSLAVHPPPSCSAALDHPGRPCRCWLCCRITPPQSFLIVLFDRLPPRCRRLCWPVPPPSCRRPGAVLPAVLYGSYTATRSLFARRIVTACAAAAVCFYPKGRDHFRRFSASFKDFFVFGFCFSYIRARISSKVF